jgi:ABC-2 type transport system permease protein
MNWHVVRAIFKRNFVSYFSSPTGYVFICVFVALSSLAAFWPNEFFNANLANLDQLNVYFPAIMLVFIPAITMSVWAEERRQGTDELLLTLPASDLDVVLGKYLASLAIFSVALLFSWFSNLLVLKALGSPDMGLFFVTYFGYWMIGMTMLAVGMVASFLTSNLTVGFILGALFNAPMVLAQYAEVITSDSETAQLIRRWSIAEQFRDFERGIVSLSSVSYFVMITAVMLYLALVLIGRRHWKGGRDGNSLWVHFAIRALSLLLVAVGVSYVFARHDVVRVDVTSEQLSSLSPDTRRLMKDLKSEYPVVIEAFISPTVPAEYIQTRLNLLSVLDELAALGGNKIQVHKHSVQTFTQLASDAEDKYGIRPRQVLSKSRGAYSQEEIFLGVAFNCGLEKEVLPFIDKGLPAEYEIVRSICVVAQEKRQKIGVLKTEVSLFGGFDPSTMGMSEDQLIVSELRKQYEVVEVDPARPIEVDQYEMLLAVQPSSLAQPEMDNFLEAVRKGLPTAVFEDPLPGYWRGVSGTMQPRRQQQPNPFMPQPPQAPKGRITELWDMLGVDMIGDEIIAQDWNPYPKVKMVQPEFIFIGEGSGANEPFNESDEITSGLQQLLFLYAGSFIKQKKSTLDYQPLCTTGSHTASMRVQTFMEEAQKGPEALMRARKGTHEKYNVSVHVKGKVKARKSDPFKGQGRFAGLEAGLCQDDPAPVQPGGAGKKPALSGRDAAMKIVEEAVAEGELDSNKTSSVNVVLVSDIDCLSSLLFEMRERGSQEDEVQWQFQNVAFALNVVDALSGDKRFMEIRKRQPKHRILEAIELKTEEAREDAGKNREKFVADFDQARSDAQRKFEEQLDKVRKREDLSDVEKLQKVRELQQHGQRQLDVSLSELEKKRDDELKQIQRDLELDVRQVQDSYKLWAVLVPPIPPLLIAFFVYFHRRSQEREGVSKSRLR